MKRPAGLTRRSLARATAAGMAWAAAPSLVRAAAGNRSALAPTPGGAVSAAPIGQGSAGTGETGRLKQSVCRWCYARMPLTELAAAARDLGLQSVELLDPKDLPVLEPFGLRCAVVNSHPLTRGLARSEDHEFCLDKIRTSIDAAAASGSPMVITFSGNRKGTSDEQGLENATRALGSVLGHAEQNGVMLVMELLNSKIDHQDYLADHTAWGVELVARVGSPSFRLLYDIYHMQIMEGDVIRTIRQHHEAIAHYHTAGVPGRHELDESQELNYPAIVRAIRETGYQGYLGQEFIPRGEPIAALGAAVRLCDV